MTAAAEHLPGACAQGRREALMLRQMFWLTPLDNPLNPGKKKNKIISVICMSVSSICLGSYSKA